MISIVKEEIIKQIIKYTLSYKNQAGRIYSAKTSKSEISFKLNLIKGYRPIA